MVWFYFTIFRGDLSIAEDGYSLNCSDKLYNYISAQRRATAKRAEKIGAG